MNRKLMSFVNTASFEGILCGPVAMDTRAKQFVNQFGCPADILTLAELAERLKVKSAVIYTQTRGRDVIRIRALCERVKMADIGPLPHVKVGRELRFSWPDVCAWLDKRAELETRLQQHRARKLA